MSGYTNTSKAEINVFLKKKQFLHSVGLLGTAPLEKRILNMLILAVETNSEDSQNYTCFRILACTVARRCTFTIYVDRYIFLKKIPELS